MSLNDSPIIQACGLSNYPAFKRPLSKKARRLVEAMLEWVTHLHIHDLWGGQHAFREDFVTNVYDQFLYEEICHQFKVDTYFFQFAAKTRLKKAVPGVFQTKEQVTDALRLNHFSKHDWLEEQQITPNDRRVQGHINKEVYDWLVDNFLVTDFSEDDLNKIAMLGNEKFDLNLIKREARNISDISKRTMAYLYAIIRDVSAREDHIRAGIHATQQKNDEQLRRLFELEAASKNKLVHEPDPDMRERWERDRVFLELARELEDENS